MAMQEVAARMEGQDRAVIVNYNFGDNLEDAVETFGEDVVFGRYLASARIECQTIIRRGISAGKTDDEIVQMVKDWKPGTRMSVKKTDVEKAREALGRMTPEERRQLLQDAGLLL